MIPGGRCNAVLGSGSYNDRGNVLYKGIDRLSDEQLNELAPYIKKYMNRLDKQDKSLTDLIVLSEIDDLIKLRIRRAKEDQEFLVKVKRLL